MPIDVGMGKSKSGTDRQKGEFLSGILGNIVDAYRPNGRRVGLGARWEMDATHHAVQSCHSTILLLILVDASATWQTGYRDSLARVGKADKGNEIANLSPRVSHIE